MKYIIFLTVFWAVLSCTSDDQYKKKMPKTNKTILQNKDSLSISNVTGNWCYTVKDSMDFNVTITQLNSLILGNYSVIMFNGKYLNASDDPKAWAFKTSKSNLSDSSVFFPIVNWYDSSMASLNIRYDRYNDVLVWKLKDADGNMRGFLPSSVILHRCKL